jgi:hypothetical protein
MIDQRPIRLLITILIALLQTSQATSCDDDLTWHGKKSVDHDCQHVGEDPENRCHWFDSNQRTAAEACPGSCDPACSVVLLAPTPLQVESCEDSTTWAAELNSEHNCAYVGQHPEYRCDWISAEGITAAVACKASCDPECNA